MTVFTAFTKVVDMEPRPLAQKVLAQGPPGSVQEVPEADKPFYIALFLLSLFAFFSAFTLYLIASYTHDASSLMEFARTLFGFLAGWVGAAVFYYLGKKA